MLVAAMKARQSGFTLIELMVTIALVALILGLGVPSFVEFSRNNRMTGAANDLLADLNLARTESVKRHVAVTVCASNDPMAATPACAGTAVTSFAGWIVFVDDANPDVAASTDGDAAFDAGAGETLLRRHPPLPTGTTAKSDKGFITYAPSGFPAAVGGVSSATRVVICDSRGNKAVAAGNSAARGISVSVTGRAGITRSIADITSLGGC
jgi:type IV fimbrial biogenesis protein FimT